MLDWNPVIAIHGLTSLVVAVVLPPAWTRRHLPGGRALFALLGFNFLWVTFAFLEILVEGIPAKHLCASFRYIGVAFTPFAFFLLAQEFGPRPLPGLRRLAPILAAAEAMVVAAAFTNPWHHLLWTSVRPGAYGEIERDHGPIYAAMVILNYGLVTAGTVRMVRAILRFPRHYRALGALLLWGISVPFAASLSYTLHLTPPGVDPTPAGLAVTGIVLVLALHRARLLDIAPVSRDLVVEGLPEGILVLDRQRRLVDFNRSARERLGIPLTIGTPLDSLPEPWRGLGALLGTAPPGDAEFPAPDGHWTEARCRPLLPGVARSSGHVVVLYDITARKAMEQRLDELARFDELTGLANRRHFQERLIQELSRCSRGDLPLALLLLDVDHFKRVNDHHGHPAGDEVLRRLGALLGSGVRTGDAAGRWGGEEFVVLLSGCSREHAIERAEHWRRRVASETFVRGGRGFAVTISLGLSLFPEHGTDPNALLARADAALYASKRNGRDRLTVAG